MCTVICICDTIYYVDKIAAFKKRSNIVKVLVLIDVQNDFIDGALPVDKDHVVTDKIVKYAYISKCEHVPLVATCDTHTKDYLETLEGKKLPIMHCIEGGDGWKLYDGLDKLVPITNRISKCTFGSITDLPDMLGDIDYNLKELYGASNGVTEIEIAGFCTDVCVVSNALILRATFPDLKITVLENLCAGTTLENHAAALQVMRCNQIDVEKAQV